MPDATMLIHLAVQAAGRRPGAGPIYVETDMHRVLVEPWNAASATLFLLMAVSWVIRLRGQYRKHAFLTACLPLMVIGAVGGTVYHAFRGQRVWLFMDWMPIAILCLAGSIYLWSKLLKRWWYALLIIPAVVILQTLNFRVFFRYFRQMGIAITYTTMAVLVAASAVGVLWKTRWRNGIFPLLAAVFFLVAISMRTLDAWAVRHPAHWVHQVLPMGSHFLWHVFGALAGQMIIVYFYRLPDALAAAGGAGAAAPAGAIPCAETADNA